MVLSQRHVSMPQTRARTTPAKATERLDAVRIAGMAAAIAVNIAAMMLLLVPVSPPASSLTLIEPETPLDWIEKKEPEKKPETPPTVELKKPQSIQPQQQAVRPASATQPVQAQQETILPDGSEYTEPQPADATPTDIIGPPITSPGPQEATRLEYATAPAPAYPRDAIMDGLQGTVYLKVLVDVDGTPLSVDIHKSSGHRKLDDAARRQVLRKWKFRPAMQDGKAIQVYGIVPVDFSLSRQ
jgi:periplasmic protein TonB